MEDFGSGRKEFEQELLKLGYAPMTELDDPQKRSSNFASSDFVRKFGSYSLIITVRHPEYGERWNAKCTLHLGPNEVVQVGPEQHERNWGYDIKEFEQAQYRLVKYLTEVFTPNAKKAIDPPKELTDLLKEK